jgi:hypothetical protein
MEQFRDREAQRAKTDELLRRLGADDVVIETVAVRIDDEEVQSVTERLRAFAQENSTVVLSALSALIAGGAIAAGRAVSKKKNAKRAAASKKSSAKRSTAKRSGAKRSTAKRSTAKRSTAKRSTAAKRTLIEPHKGDKRFIRRDAKGRIKESVDVGRSLSADQRSKSKTKAKAGFGDKGDR